MSLSQANIELISTVLNVPVEEISGAISNENEVSLDLKLNGKVYKQEDIDFIKNDSFKRGAEIRTKDLAESFNIELSNGEHKDLSNLINKVKSSLENTYEEKYKNQTPPEELENALKSKLEWEQKYNKLLETHENREKEIGEWSDKFTSLENKIKLEKRNNTILSSFPEKMKMDREDALTIIANKLEFEESENGLVVKKEGQIVTDALGNPEKLENVIKSFVEEKGWIKGSGMNGSDKNGHSSNMPSGLDYEAATKYLEEKGIDPMSAEGSQKFMELTK